MKRKIVNVILIVIFGIFFILVSVWCFSLLFDVYTPNRGPDNPLQETHDEFNMLTDKQEDELLEIFRKFKKDTGIVPVFVSIRSDELRDRVAGYGHGTWMDRGAYEDFCLGSGCILILFEAGGYDWSYPYPDRPYMTKKDGSLSVSLEYGSKTREVFSQQMLSNFWDSIEDSWGSNEDTLLGESVLDVLSKSLDELDMESQQVHYYFNSENVLFSFVIFFLFIGFSAFIFHGRKKEYF